MKKKTFVVLSSRKPWRSYIELHVFHSCTDWWIVVLAIHFWLFFFLMVCLFEIVGVFHSNITCFLKCFVFYSPQMDFSSYIFCTFRYIWVFFPLSPLCIHTYPIYTSLDPVCFRYFALIIFFPAYFLIRICRFFIAFPNHQRLQCLSCPSYLAVQLLTLDYRD